MNNNSQCSIQLLKLLISSLFVIISTTSSYAFDISGQPHFVEKRFERTTHAGRLAFGVTERKHYIKEIKLKGPNEESLYLGYITATISMGAGMYLFDAGYYLGVKNNNKIYYSLPDSIELKNLQEKGLIPYPLPVYHISILEYLFGYSLWILMAIYMIPSLIRKIKKRKERAGIIA